MAEKAGASAHARAEQRLGWVARLALNAQDGRIADALGLQTQPLLPQPCAPAAHVVRAVLKMGLMGSDSAKVTAHGSTSDSHLRVERGNSQRHCFKPPQACLGKLVHHARGSAWPAASRAPRNTASHAPHLLLLLLRNAVLSPPASRRPATSGAAPGRRFSVAYSSLSGAAEACGRAGVGGGFGLRAGRRLCAQAQPQTMRRACQQIPC